MSRCSVVPLVLQFIKAGSKQPASNPGFSHALKLSYNLISKERLKWAGDTLTYRYRLSEDMGKFSASLLLAIMDDLTTNACFGAGMPSSPGVSLQMSLGLCRGRQCSRLYSLRELDVVSTVTKLGRTISFTQTNFIDPEHEEVLAFGSHIKYMPIGNLIMNIVFNQKWAWDIYSRFSLGSPPRFYEEKCLYKDVLGKNIIHMGIGTASFHVTSEHTNPFGGLHGGCHAVLMEIVGERLAIETLKSPNQVILNSISIEYIATARRGTLTVKAVSVTESQMKVMIRSEEGRTLSIGTLVWSTESISSKL